MFPDNKDFDARVADVSNYCRNPSLAGAKYVPLPWCYTNSSDVIWEFCNIPRCKGTALSVDQQNSTWWRRIEHLRLSTKTSLTLNKTQNNLVKAESLKINVAI